MRFLVHFKRRSSSGLIKGGAVLPLEVCGSYGLALRVTPWQIVSGGEYEWVTDAAVVLDNGWGSSRGRFVLLQPANYWVRYIGEKVVE